MKEISQIICAAFVLSSLLLCSCGNEGLPLVGKNPAEKQTEEMSSQINSGDWKPIINKMTDDFAFHYSKTYQGKNKADGGKPFRASIKRKDFVSYSHTVKEVKKIDENKYIVNANAILEISYNENGRKEAEWPLQFTWIKKGDEWKLAAVKYLEKRNFVTTIPSQKITPAKKEKAPARPYATEETATSLSIKSDIGAGNEAQQKTKQSIRDKVNELSTKNRQR